jgi:Zn-dependent protease with chaperone function
MESLIAPAGVAALLLALSSPLFSVLSRLLYRTRPLEPGPLRQSLLAMSRAAGVALRDIRVLPGAAGRRPGGLLLGLTARTWEVVLAEALLSPENAGDLEPLFAHELGHARRRHPLRRVLFLGGSLLLLASLLSMAPPHWPWFAGPLLVLSSAGLFLVSLAALHRRWEIEADLEAAGLVGAARYRGFLERAARASRGLSSGWVHPSPERRLERASQLELPDRREAFERAGRRLRAALFFLLIAALFSSFLVSAIHW